MKKVTVIKLCCKTIEHKAILIGNHTNKKAVKSSSLNDMQINNTPPKPIKQKINLAE